MKRMGLVLVGMLCCTVAWADDAKKELEKFEGEWKVLSFEVKGQKGDVAEFKDFKLTIKGDKFTFQAREDKLEGTIKPDGSKSPRTLDVTGKDSAGATVTSAGIYEFDKDTMKICYVVNSQDRPKEFKTSPDSEAFLVVYQREKK